MSNYNITMLIPSLKFQSALKILLVRIREELNKDKVVTKAVKKTDDDTLERLVMSILCRRSFKNHT